MPQVRTKYDSFTLPGIEERRKFKDILKISGQLNDLPNDLCICRWLNFQQLDR